MELSTSVPISPRNRYMPGKESSLRPLTRDERELLTKLLSPKFPGRDALLLQIEGIRVRQIDAEGSLQLVPERDAPLAPVEHRVPVEAELPGESGLTVRILLHVVDGLLHELEIYRDDLGPIERPLLPEKLRLTLFQERED
jgi:hypothetical protein